jgi:hypothetical protein
MARFAVAACATSPGHLKPAVRGICHKHVTLLLNACIPEARLRGKIFGVENWWKPPQATRPNYLKMPSVYHT